MVHEGGAKHSVSGRGLCCFQMKTPVTAEGETGEGRGPAQRGKSHSERHTEGGEGRGVRPGPEVRGQEEEGSTQNMVVSYLVLIVRLDSLGSTSHVALPCD